MSRGTRICVIEKLTTSKTVSYNEMVDRSGIYRPSGAESRILIDTDIGLRVFIDSHLGVTDLVGMGLYHYTSQRFEIITDEKITLHFSPPSTLTK